MSALNQFSCLTISANTGIGACPVNFKNIVGAILTPKGFKATTASLAAFKTALINAAQAAQKSSRLYPVYDFRPLADNSEAPVIQTFPTGQKVVVREGVSDWTFQFIAGGIDLLKRLRLLNAASTSYDFYFVDSQNFILGVSDEENDALMAIPSDGGFFWAHPWKSNDGSKVAEYSLQFTFLPKYINELLGYVKADFDVQSTVFGLKDVVLSSPSVNVTSGSYNVAVKLKDGGEDMGGRYETELETIANWAPKNKATGGAITVTSSTYVPGTPGYFTLALSTADPDYPDIPGNITFGLAAPLVLAANGLEGFESNTVDIASNTAP
ncbi:hypothetical protein [Paraflavitalea speifideaquila]|uniref:hypothetical protein n=1 Tax=Paraflavitalea speifideaquila TaxID=3076558 RepID=UPI0028E28B29|nr:hypothetical protein [Paraflavitalea speifideiaquila]